MENRYRYWIEIRREKLKNKILSDMFPKNRKDHAMDRRQNEKFVIRKAKIER